MKNRIAATIGLVLFCAMAVFANGGKEASSQQIVVGCLQDVSGPTSSLGKMVEAGAKWALDEINAAGGVNGVPVKMITYDTKGDVTEAINAYTRAVTADKVSAIIGPPVANIALAIAPMSEQYNVPILGYAIDPKAQINPKTNKPYKNMFAFQPNASQQGGIMASFAMKNGFKKFGIIYNQGNAYSVSLLQPFVDTVNAAGGTVIAPVPYNPNDKDFKTLLGKIIAEKPDAIYMPNYTQELILISQQARQLGFTGALISGLDACPPFNKLFGENCEGVYFINNIDDTEPQLQAMIKKVKETTGIDATNKFFLGYDVMNILCDIIGKVGSDPAKVAQAASQVKDYSGLTGKISIDPNTHMPVGPEMVMFTYVNTNVPKMLERYSIK